MTRINELLNGTSAGLIAQKLDEKDGEKNNSITSDIWNTFVADKGGKRIAAGTTISVENAMNSITKYACKQASGSENANDLGNKWLKDVEKSMKEIKTEKAVEPPVEPPVVPQEPVEVPAEGVPEEEEVPGEEEVAEDEEVPGDEEVAEEEGTEEEGEEAMYSDNTTLGGVGTFSAKYLAKNAKSLTDTKPIQNKYLNAKAGRKIKKYRKAAGTLAEAEKNLSDSKNKLSDLRNQKKEINNQIKETRNQKPHLDANGNRIKDKAVVEKNRAEKQKKLGEQRAHRDDISKEIKEQRKTVEKDQKTKNSTAKKTKESKKSARTSLDKANKAAGKTPAKTAGKTTGKTAGKTAGKAVGKTAGKTTAKSAAKATGKTLLKKIPGVGLIAGLAFAADRLAHGDFVGAGLEAASGVVSTVPGLGTAASCAIDAGILVRDIA